jgi:hypothetical protein
MGQLYKHEPEQLLTPLVSAPYVYRALPLLSAKYLPRVASVLVWITLLLDCPLELELLDDDVLDEPLELEYGLLLLLLLELVDLCISAYAPPAAMIITTTAITPKVFFCIVNCPLILKLAT